MRKDCPRASKSPPDWNTFAYAFSVGVKKNAALSDSTSPGSLSEVSRIQSTGMP